jgi:hypothetical protein
MTTARYWTFANEGHLLETSAALVRAGLTITRVSGPLRHMTALLLYAEGPLPRTTPGRLHQIFIDRGVPMVIPRGTKGHAAIMAALPNPW